MKQNQRSSFTGKLGFVMSAAGASVGLGNIWRFPYLAAKYGGGIFILVYIVLALTFGYTMIITESAIGRSTKQSPVGAFGFYKKNAFTRFGGWINTVIPALIVPYYSVIGGWVCKYLYAFCTESMETLTADGYFSEFITGTQSEIWFIVFSILVLAVIWMGVENGIERVSRLIMPVLVVLAVVISLYAMTMPGAMQGVAYVLIPHIDGFSWMTVVAAMGQMFYSLSIAMGILITFGSYMKDDVSIEDATRQVELFDTVVAILASLMIIPAVFAFAGNDPAALKQGPSLMFVTLPKVFASMRFGRLIGILFFVLVLFAALTSAIALCESVVSTFTDVFSWNRKTGTLAVAVIMFVLGSLSCLGYGILSFVQLLGKPFLDFFDFLTNSVMMPVSALAICIYSVKYMGLDTVEAEVTKNGHPFRRRKIYHFMIKWICPLFILIILLSSIADAFGLIAF